MKKGKVNQVLLPRTKMPADSAMCCPLQRRLYDQCPTILLQLLTGHCCSPTLCFGQSGPPRVEALFFSSKSKGSGFFFLHCFSRKVVDPGLYFFFLTNGQCSCWTNGWSKHSNGVLEYTKAILENRRMKRTGVLQYDNGNVITSYAEPQ